VQFWFWTLIVQAYQKVYYFFFQENDAFLLGYSCASSGFIFSIHFSPSSAFMILCWCYVTASNRFTHFQWGWQRKAAYFRLKSNLLSMKKQTFYLQKVFIISITITIIWFKQTAYVLWWLWFLVFYSLII